MNCVDNRNECVGGFEQIGRVVRFGCWEIVLRVHVCGDGSSIGIVCDTTECEAVGFDRDRFIGVSLEQA